jgi:CheY-like chemotaxis protein/DNA-binding phage protein
MNTAAPLKILLGNAIKSTRSARGMSQEQLAARAGLHRTYVSDVERGARNPSLESVQKLAQALELSLPALLQEAQKDRELVEILLVEDNPHDVELTVRAFKKARLTNPIHVARDGNEAIDFLFANGRYTHRKDAPLPEVILLDLNLPKKSGIEVLRQIKADQRTRHIPVVILTVSNRSRDISACRRLGAESYIVKPVDFHNFSDVATRLSLSWMLIKPNGVSSAQPNEDVLNQP